MRRWRWTLVGVAVVMLLEFGAQALNPGTGRSLLTKGGSFELAVSVVGFALTIGLLGYAAFQYVRGLWLHREPRFFATDPGDAEQARANEELSRINELADADADAEGYETAYREWLVGERRREEARFMIRRQRAQLGRRAMTQYVREIRAQLELNRSLEPEAGEEAEFAEDIRRLEEELAWAQAALEQFVGG